MAGSQGQGTNSVPWAGWQELNAQGIELEGGDGVTVGCLKLRACPSSHQG